MKPSTQQWLEFAKADLINCERILEDEFLTTILAFHSQQVVEKCFKALINEKNIDIPRIHSLVRLYQLVEGFLENQIEIRELMALDSVYTSSRYPSDIGMIATGKPTRQDALSLYESAKKIFESITELIA
ncbi:MAG TPA: HEPN domain-containing protein [Prolixibacteraceae bacterium]|nr:HEPN domain-containing protein [Prolixibacteraceae bacterium]